MKKVTLLFAMLIALSSCSSMQQAKYSSVEKLMALKTGSTLEEVSKVMGSMPYDVLSHQIEGYSIYVYNYRVVERKVSMANLKKLGYETQGEEVYGDQSNAYLIFKDGKLDGYITDMGREESVNIVFLNNTLYAISKEKESFNIQTFADYKRAMQIGGDKKDSGIFGSKKKSSSSNKKELKEKDNDEE